MSEWKTSISNILQKTNHNLGYREKADISQIVETQPEKEYLLDSNHDNLSEQNRKEISLLKNDVEELFKNLNKFREEISTEMQARTSLVHEVARKVRDDLRSEFSSVQMDFQERIQDSIAPIEVKQANNQQEMENILFKMKKLEQLSNLQRKELYSKLDSVDNQYQNMSRYVSAFNQIYETVKTVEQKANYWDKRLNDEMKVRENKNEQNILQRIKNLEREVDEMKNRPQYEKLEAQISSTDIEEYIEQIKGSLSHCMQTAARVSGTIESIEYDLYKYNTQNNNETTLDDNQIQYIKDIFQNTNTKDNNFIETYECMKILQTIFPNISEKKLRNIMLKVDVEKDNRFTWNKFYKILLSLDEDGIRPLLNKVKSSESDEDSTNQSST